MKSERLKKQYATASYWVEGLNTSIWNNLGQFKAEEDKTVRYELEDLIWKIREKIDAVYGPKIGKAVMAEIRSQK